jgi:hypothetical protein
VERALPTTVLSLVLPILTVAYGSVVSTWLLGYRATVSIDNDAITYAGRFLRWTFKRQVVRLEALRAAHAVAAQGVTPTHVLLRERNRWVAFPVAGPPATEVITAITDSSAPAKRPGQLAEATENARFSSARTASG